MMYSRKALHILMALINVSRQSLNAIDIAPHADIRHAGQKGGLWETIKHLPKK